MSLFTKLQLQLFVAYAVHEVIEPQLASVVAEAHQTSSLVSRASHQSCPIELMSSLVANGDHFHLYSIIIFTTVISSFHHYSINLHFYRCIHLSSYHHFCYNFCLHLSSSSLFISLSPYHFMYIWLIVIWLTITLAFIASSSSTSSTSKFISTHCHCVSDTWLSALWLQGTRFVPLGMALCT